MFSIGMELPIKVLWVVFTLLAAFQVGCHSTNAAFNQTILSIYLMPKTAQIYTTVHKAVNKPSVFYTLENVDLV